MQSSKSKAPVRAWWFEPANGLLGYNDGRRPEACATHKIRGKPVLCRRGLHASLHPRDALLYAQSTRLWLVEVSGSVLYGDDKLVGTERKYLKSYDIEELLFEFARKQALSVMHLWKAPDVVRRYLETGDPAIRDAARDAARAAARDAARDAGAAAWDAGAAAWDAARAAARDAARDAARAAARDAARDAGDAARVAARAAAWAARDAARDAGAAAWDAGAAAWDAGVAAEKRQREEFLAMVETKFGLR